MPIGLGEELTLELFHSRNWRTREDLNRFLQVLFEQFDIQPITGRPGAALRPDDISVGKDDLLPFFQQRTLVLPETLREKYFGITEEEWLSLDLHLSSLDAYERRVRLGCRTYWEAFNDMVFRAPVYYLEDLEILRPLSDLFVAMAKELVALADPGYLRIGEDDDFLEPPFPDEVIRRDVKTIYWVNYFGPGFLGKTREKAFLDAPFGKAMSHQGGLWYQLDDDFLALGYEPLLDFENGAEAYFRKYFELDRVQWRFVPG